MSKALKIEKVIRCAQALFAKSGYDSISLRQIADEAQIGLGTINFYFGSKEGLFQEVIERTTRQLNEHRIGLLERTSADGEFSSELEHVLHAIIWPILSRAFSEDPLERSVPYLIRWALTGPPHVEQALRRTFDPVSERLLCALIGACPGLTRCDAIWGYSIVIAMLYSRQVLDHRYSHLMGGSSPLAANAQAQTSQLATFAVGGFIELANRRLPGDSATTAR